MRGDATTKQLICTLKPQHCINPRFVLARCISLYVSLAVARTAESSKDSPFADSTVASTSSRAPLLG